MNARPEHEHLSAERIQALLDGALPSRERVRAEEHLASCARCASQAEAWRGLFSELGELPRLVPHEGFAERVMAEVDAPAAPLPLAARIRARLAALVRGPEMVEHPGAPGLQDFVEGLLPRRRAARVAQHLEGCASCAGEAAEWSAFLGRLDGLERFAPSEGFAARVLAGVEVPAATPARRPVRERLAAAAARLFPNPRQVVAALSGVAVAPLATLGLVVYTLVSHPTLTPGALLSFAWWKLSDAAGVAFEGLAGQALESAGVFQVWSVLEALAQSPGTVAAGFLTFSILTVAALWVLYRNLFAHRTANGSYAHATL